MRIVVVCDAASHRVGVRLGQLVALSATRVFVFDVAFDQSMEFGVCDLARC